MRASSCCSASKPAGLHACALSSSSCPKVHSKLQPIASAAMARHSFPLATTPQGQQSIGRRPLAKARPLGLRPPTRGPNRRDIYNEGREQHAHTALTATTPSESGANSGGPTLLGRQTPTGSICLAQEAAGPEWAAEGRRDS